jgi:Thioredoxin
VSALQKFAPTWKQVADHYAGSEIKVGAVNCIDNKELCRTLNIGLFPALRALNVAVEAGGTQPGENGLLTIQDGATKFEKILDWVKQRYPNAVTAGANDAAAAAAVAEEQVPAVVDAAQAQQPAAAGGGGDDDKVSAAAASAASAAFVPATCEQRFVDAASSFSFALQNHVPSGKGAMAQSRTGEHYAIFTMACFHIDHLTPRTCSKCLPI